MKIDVPGQVSPAMSCEDSMLPHELDELMMMMMMIPLMRNRRDQPGRRRLSVAMMTMFLCRCRVS
jgi:hypothetical protein